MIAANLKPLPASPCTRKEYAGGYPAAAQRPFRSQGRSRFAPSLKREGWGGLGLSNERIAAQQTGIRHRPSCAGFTLLEVLVALFILAISMAAVSRTASTSIDHVDAMRTRIIADWVAQNRLAQHQARGDYPPPGIHLGEEAQAGQIYPWQEEIIATPNPTMRRIVVNVYAPGDAKHSLRELTGFLVQYPR